MERVYLNNNGSGKGKKSANTAAKRKAEADHAAWLKSQGLHPDQLAARKKNFTVSKPTVSPSSSPPVKLSNNLRVTGGFRKSIMDHLDKEKPEVKKAILDKAFRLAPAYSKGAYQYISPGTELSDIGKKK